MIWPILALATFGFMVAAKAKPRTQINRRQAFGPKTGETWDVEDFPDAKLIVVHSRRDSTLATFHTTIDASTSPARRRFKFSQGKGNHTIIEMMRSDFEGETPPA